MVVGDPALATHDGSGEMPTAANLAHAAGMAVAQSGGPSSGVTSSTAPGTPTTPVGAAVVALSPHAPPPQLRAAVSGATLGTTITGGASTPTTTVTPTTATSGTTAGAGGTGGTGGTSSSTWSGKGLVEVQIVMELCDGGSLRVRVKGGLARADPRVMHAVPRLAAAGTAAGTMHSSLRAVEPHSPLTLCCLACGMRHAPLSMDGSCPCMRHARVRACVAACRAGVADCARRGHHGRQGGPCGARGADRTHGARRCGGPGVPAWPGRGAWRPQGVHARAPVCACVCMCACVCCVHVGEEGGAVV